MWFTYLALLFCLCALTLAPAAACMSGRAKYCHSREGWAYTTPVPTLHWCRLSALHSAHYARVCIPILCDKQWDRPAPGVCSLSDDSCFCSTASWWNVVTLIVHQVLVPRRRQQVSGIDDGSRFCKLFISFLTSLIGGPVGVLFSCCRYLPSDIGTNYGHCCRMSLE